MSNVPVAPANASLRQKTVGGVMWLAVQNISTRAISLLQQLALAWLLAKSDFGLIGLAYTVSTFAALLSNPASMRFWCSAGDGLNAGPRPLSGWA